MFGAKLSIYLFSVLGSPWTSGFTLSLLRAASLNWQSPLAKKNPQGQLISPEFCLLSCSLCFSSFSCLPYVKVCMSSLCTKYTCTNTDTHTQTQTHTQTHTHRDTHTHTHKVGCSLVKWKGSKLSVMGLTTPFIYLFKFPGRKDQKSLSDSKWCAASRSPYTHNCNCLTSFPS